MGSQPQCDVKPGDFDSLAKHMISLLPEQDRERLASAWRGQSLHVGTMCSGTDLCVRVLKAISQALGVDTKHRFSCDSSVPVQRWLKSQFSEDPPDLIFNDVLMFDTAQAYDINSMKSKPIPPVDVVYLGFSCKDVSHLNRSHGNSRACVRSGTLRTGSTLSASAAYIRRVLPQMFFLENVTALEDTDPAAGSSNAQDVEKMCLSMGYILVSAVLDARTHGSAQRRTRWWGAAFRVAVAPASAERAAAFEPARRRMEFLLGAMEMKPMELDNALFEEGSTQLLEWQRAREEMSNMPKTDDSEPTTKNKKADWPLLHMEHYRVHGLRYPPVLELFYTEAEMKVLRTFPRRAQEVIAFVDISEGRAMVEEVIDPSQSINRFPRLVSGAPCTTPKGVPWLRRRFRRLEAPESLALQGWRLLEHGEISAVASSAEIQSLAGNAFNAHTAMAMTIAAMSIVGLGGFHPFPPSE